MLGRLKVIVVALEFVERSRWGKRGASRPHLARECAVIPDVAVVFGLERIVETLPVEPGWGGASVGFVGGDRGGVDELGGLGCKVHLAFLS